MNKLRVSIAIALVVVLVGTVIYSLAFTGDDKCEQWQERYIDLAESAPEGGVGAFDFINMGPLAELRKERPDGCSVPEVP